MKKIKEVRKRLNISQALLAKRTGISRFRISELECGYKDASQKEKGLIWAVLVNKQTVKKSTIGLSNDN
jgi:transcriptional regulator with XRE-family HTH domain